MKIYRGDEGRVNLVKRDGSLYDVIYEILQEDCRFHKDKLDISKDLKADYNGLRKLYHRVKSEMNYELDDKGMQLVRSPEYAWGTRNCIISKSKYCSSDCKAFSIVIASQLKRMGIPYYYRFVAWPKDDPKKERLEHIYVIAILPDGREVIMDATYYKGFDKEGPYSFKKDYDTKALCNNEVIGNQYRGKTEKPAWIKWGVAAGLLGWFIYQMD